MALPSRLKKMDDEANERIRGIQQTADGSPVAEPEPESETAEAVVPENSEHETVPVEIPAEPEAATPQRDIPADEVSSLKEQLAQADRRYKTLQGMMERARDNESSLRELVSQLTAQVQQLAKQTPPTPQVETRLVTDKDEEAFGSDLVDLVRRAASEVVKGEIGKLDGRFADVDTRVAQVGQVAAKSAEERFAEALTLKVPDWEAINMEPEFTAWLGKWNLKALNDAYSERDVAGTAKFFEDYKVLTGKQDEPVQQEAPPNPSAKLESMQAPTRTKSATPSNSVKQARTWTSADITKLYEDQRKNRISDAEFRAQEADLFKAQGEGRVIR